MSQGKITTEQLIETRILGLTLREIAEKLRPHIRDIEARHAKLAKESHFHGNDSTAKNVPEGFMVKGTSTMIDADGTEKMRWVKTSVDNERLAVQWKQRVLHSVKTCLRQNQPNHLTRKGLVLLKQAGDLPGFRSSHWRACSQA
ncbi:hypothetical protein vBSsoS008_072 [Shigella phage vB_SsoS_008]|nr:hypothetical protein vBSsoS008_072 [Shigella phage vB_SsoS_008]